MILKRNKRPANIFIRLAFNKAVILAAVAIVGLMAVRSELPGLPSLQEVSNEVAIAANCEDRSSLGTVEACIDRGIKIDAQLSALAADIDAKSLESCRETFGADRDAVWDCTKLNDGRALASVYRRPTPSE